MTTIARGVQQRARRRYKALQDIIAILGMDELSEDDRLTVARARKIQRFCRSRSTSPRTSPAAGVFVNLEHPIMGFKGIVAGVA